MLMKFVPFLVATRLLLWNAGELRNGDLMVWAGTYVRLECGPIASLTLGDDGLHWLIACVEPQEEFDDFEADGVWWEGMIGR